MNEEPFLRATSPDGRLTLGVFEEDDFLVGLRGDQWHTHGPLLVPEYGPTPKEAAIGFFESVVQDREIIVVSKRPGKEEEVWITQDADSDVRYMEDGESLSLRYWSGREIAHHRKEANKSVQTRTTSGPV